MNWTDGICWGIILKESSTMQFYNGAVDNYPDTVRMPYVSDDGRPGDPDDPDGIWGNDNDGSHVGLMQVVTTKERSWNWLTNTEYGVDFYQGDKLDIALGHWQDVKDENPDATKWTAEQLEDSAVGKYGPYAGVGITMTRSGKKLRTLASRTMWKISGSGLKLNVHNWI